jgi:predicted nicotinamide N-methyase
MSDLPPMNSIFDDAQFRPRPIVPVDSLELDELETELEETTDDNDNDDDRV